MPDIFASSSTLYNGSESTRSGFTNAYPPKRTTSETVTASTVAPSSTQSKFGGTSLRFDGSANASIYVGAEWTDALNVSVGWDGSITAEAWVRLDAVTGNQSLFALRNIDSNGNTQFNCNFALFTVGNQLVFYDTAQFFAISGSNYISTADITSSPFGTLVAATWHHVAWVSLTTTNKHFVYLDGTKVFEYTANRPNTTNFPYSTIGTPLPVTMVYGGVQAVGSPYTTVGALTGYMDDVRFSHVARYTANFTPPVAAFDTTVPSVAFGTGTAPSPATVAGVGAYRMQGVASSVGKGTSDIRLGAKIFGVPLPVTDPIAGKIATLFIDSTVPGLAPFKLIGGPTESSTQAKFGTKSIRFPGTGVVLGGGMSVTDGELKTTIDFWIRPDASSGTQILADRYPNSSSGLVSWTLLLVSGALVLHTNEGTDFATLPAGSISAGVWTYIRWTVVGTTNVLFVDGTEVVRASMSSVYGLSDYGSVADFGNLKDYAGRTWTSLIYPTANPFVGYMDDIRETQALRNSSNFVTPIFEASLDTGSSVQGNGSANGVSVAAAEATAKRLSQGSGLSFGTSAISANATRVRQGVASSAGTVVVFGDMGTDAAPPALDIGWLFTVTLDASTTSDASVSSDWALSNTSSATVLHDAAHDAAFMLTPTWVTQQELSGELMSLLQLLASLPQQNELGLAWVVNTLTGGSSKYEQFDFNSFGSLENSYIGCKSDGIYVLEGDDDAGQAIRASVSFGTHDLGSQHVQRMLKGYADLASTGSMTLRVTAGTETFDYTSRDSSEVLTTQRFDVGRGLEARYFTFALFNNDGCDFTLTNAEFLTADVMHRRI